MEGLFGIIFNFFAKLFLIAFIEIYNAVAFCFNFFLRLFYWNSWWVSSDSSDSSEAIDSFKLKLSNELQSVDRIMWHRGFQLKFSTRSFQWIESVELTNPENRSASMRRGSRGSSRFSASPFEFESPFESLFFEDWTESNEHLVFSFDSSTVSTVSITHRLDYLHFYRLIGERPKFSPNGNSQENSFNLQSFSVIVFTENLRHSNRGAPWGSIRLAKNVLV